MQAVTAAAVTDAIAQSLSRGKARITIPPITADINKANPGSW